MTIPSTLSNILIEGNTIDAGYAVAVLHLHILH